jgi:DNA-directed RNA polymerase subunit RPC12/RpoP
MGKLKSKFKEVSTDKEYRLRYEGFCLKCGKIMSHRIDSGGTEENTGNVYTNYRCIKCKNITKEYKFKRT